MTAIAMNYVVNPLQDVWKVLNNFFEVTGYARAAAELHRLGYHAEAKHCMMQVKKIRASR